MYHTHHYQELAQSQADADADRACVVPPQLLGWLQASVNRSPLGVCRSKERFEALVMGLSWCLKGAMVTSAHQTRDLHTEPLGGFTMW